MLSREHLAGFADAPPRLAPPRFPLTPEQFSALKAALRAIGRICCESEDRDAEPEAGASLTEQLEAAEARRETLAPAIDDAMAAQDALAAAGLELSVRDRHLVVSRRRPMAPQVAFERASGE
jgi:hypothetical protein